MIARTCRIEGNQQYSSIKNQRSWFVSRTTRQATPHDNQLMSKHRVLSLKPQLRLEWRGQTKQSSRDFQRPNARPIPERKEFLAFDNVLHRLAVWMDADMRVRMRRPGPRWQD
jgi:hypothetical protein